jgi:murein DD-endopeptidase MepM/ murein hydrolase activator NlpD
VKRIVTIVAALGLVPIVAWASAAAVPDEAVDCTSPTTNPGAECLATAPGAAVEPVAPSTTTSTSTTTTTTTTTTVVPVPSEPSTPSSTDPSASTTTVGSTPDSEPDTTTTTPAATTTTSVPPIETTTALDPNATSTTAVDPAATTTTPDPAAPPASVAETPATAPAAPPPLSDDDIESGPVAPPVETPSGRVVIPSGSADTGQVRAITFPVAGPVSYVNDFGACRDGCTRAHKGNDVIGDRLQPLLAMHDGVIDHLIIDHPTAGYGVAIRGDDGWRYDTYHMNNDTPGTDDGADDGTWRFLPGIVDGARVTAGQQIGWMGDSGNAEGSVPHVHVEIHTPEGQAVNPYWSLRAAQRAVNCMVGTVGEPMPTPVTPAAADAAVAGAAAAATTAAPTTSTTVASQALADGASAALNAPDLAATTKADAGPSATDWLDAGWTSAALPSGWVPFTVTGGHPNSGQVAARFWISTLGFTPVDGAAARVGDPRYDAGVDCVQPTVEGPSTNIPAALGAILATIRAMETGGDYSTTITTSTASGAYAFLDSSWGGYGGYARAKDAPPAVQDAKAAEMASSVLQRNGGDVSTVPVSWYIGHVPGGAEWDTVPVPSAGNKLTPRQYQDRWMKKYAQLIGDPSAWVSSNGGAPTAAADISKTCRTIVINVGDPDTPVYALAQAQSFLVAADGRAVPSAADACDPGRALDAAPPAVPAPPTPLHWLATLVSAPGIKSTGAR